MDGNGFLFKVNNYYDLAMKINRILSLKENQLHTMRIAAYSKVVKERNFHKNFKLLIDSLWTRVDPIDLHHKP
jgi:hypothetical protein